MIARGDSRTNFKGMLDSCVVLGFLWQAESNRCIKGSGNNKINKIIYPTIMQRQSKDFREGIQSY